MVDFLSSLANWHWLILGFVFLGLEALGAGGFLLGSALGALLVAAMLWFAPALLWSWQLVWFGLGSLLFTLGYWRLFRRVNEKTDHNQLNNRAAQLIGRVLDVTEPIIDGQGRVQIGDTLWKVRASDNIESGEKIRVVGTDGMVLLIERCSSGS